MANYELFNVVYFQMLYQIFLTLLLESGRVHHPLQQVLPCTSLSRNPFPLQHQGVPPCVESQNVTVGRIHNCYICSGNVAIWGDGFVMSSRTRSRWIRLLSSPDPPRRSPPPPPPPRLSPLPLRHCCCLALAYPCSVPPPPLPPPVFWWRWRRCCRQRSSKRRRKLMKDPRRSWKGSWEAGLEKPGTKK